MFRQLARWLSVVAFSGLLAGCGVNGPAPAASLTTVRVAEPVRSIFYAPQYVAMTKGFFKQEGLDVQLTTAWGSDKAAAQALSGQIEIALAGPETGLYILDRGDTTYLKLFAELTATDGSLLVGKQPNPAFKWEDLKGKTVIGNRPGSSPEMVLEEILRQHGLKPGKDVTVITNLANNAIPGAFQAGKADFAELWEPTPEAMEASGSGYVVASPGQAIGNIPYTGYLARTDYIAKHPDVIQKFTNAVYRAQQWVQKASDQDVAEAVKSFFPKTDETLIVKAVQRYRTVGVWQKDPLLAPADLARFEALLLRNGKLKNPIAYSQYVDARFAEKAMGQ